MVSADNSVKSTLTVTTALSGDKEFAFDFAKDGDTAADTTLAYLNLSDGNGYRIHVVENETMVVNDKILVNSGDKGRILQLTSIGTGTSSSDKISFQDVITAENFDFSTGFNNGTSRNIDGQPYYVQANASGSSTTKWATLTWGAGSAQGNPGTQTTLFPRIKTKNGGWFTVLSAVNITNAITYSVPGVDSLTSYESGTAFTFTNNQTNITVGKIVYEINATNATGTTSSGSLTSVVLGGAGGARCNFNNFNATYSGTNVMWPSAAFSGPAILFQEEKTSAGSGSTNGEYVCIPLGNEASGNNLIPAVGTPVYSDGLADGNNGASTLATLSSAATKSQGVTIWGTLIERDTTDANKVTLMYPDTQMLADVLFSAPEVTVENTDDGTTTGTGIKELGSVTVSDSEASSVSDKNLIVVGGSCVNSVAASLLGGALCGADFESKTGVGAGSFLIQTFDRTGGKVATLVAGYNAGDTTNAAKYLTTQKLDVEKAGTKYKGTSATEATLSSEASSAGNATG